MKSKNVYERKINYYETDRMGIVHHSNYIRFMEEARCDWLESVDMPFAAMEEVGVTIPTIAVNCEYKHHVSFGDTILIEMYTTEYTGVRMTVKYAITHKLTGKIVATGETKHCFTNKELKPINLKKYAPQFSEKFEGLLEEASRFLGTPPKNI